MNEMTTVILLGGLMGFLGGLLTIPINALFNSWLKREELEYFQKLESIARQRELLLQHRLDMEQKSKDKLMDQISKRLDNLEKSPGHE
jgi:hypothetical protein